ncbi:hypothetical protein SBD_5042 [Streptomyces bottropensis ATCC 25435]|uniref:Uncharacterized protein n=1 Tax=Streptomyces bottropensis ATCC 25435 TaxID=1054862 RepID=M3FN20_9ACTN|nr:hypothetical protein SBD_5042 [Streptomyces bottropensis ATCC 25435]
MCHALAVERRTVGLRCPHLELHGTLLPRLPVVLLGSQGPSRSGP